MMYIKDANVTLYYAANSLDKQRPGSSGSYVNCKRDYKILENGDLQIITDEDTNAELQDLDTLDENQDEETLEDDISELSFSLPPHDKIDFCVQAKAYAPSGTEVSNLVCEIKYGDYSRKRTIFGDRTFTQYVDGTSSISEPQLFRSMPIGTANCFGSPDFSLNRHGKGYIYRLEDDPEYADDMKEIAAADLMMEEYLKNEEEDVETQVVDEGFKDHVPDPFVENIDDDDQSEDYKEIEYQVAVPNVENSLDPYIDPFTVIDHEGFFHSPINWIDKAIAAGDQQNIDPMEFDIFLHTDASAYQQAFVDQQFEVLPEGTSFEFINMREDTQNFHITLPNEAPRCYVAKRLFGLELQEIVMKKTLISVDLIKDKVTILWQGYDDRPTATNVTQELYDTKYVYAFFDTVPAIRPFDEIQLDFSEKTKAMDEAEEAAIGAKEEDVEKKIDDVMNVLVDQLEGANIDEDIIEEIKSQPDLDKTQEFYMQLVKKTKSDMDDFIDEINKEAEAMKKQNDEN